MAFSTNDRQNYIGVIIAIAGNLCISVALNIQKYVHNRLALTPPDGHEDEPLLSISDFEDADEIENKAYYQDRLWWIGQLLITVGEIGNFVAYGFSSAILVAPLGTVALISNAIIAPMFLDEELLPHHIAGIIFAIIGTVLIIVASSQTEEPVLTFEELLNALNQPIFILYCAVAFCLFIVLSQLSKKGISKKFIYIDLGLVAIFGAFTVLSTKALSSFMNTDFITMLSLPITYVLLFVLISTAVLQVSYLNQALSKFDSTVVVPVNFVMFTTSTLIGSAILYRDFEHMATTGTILSLLGIFIMFFGVYLITLPKTQHIQLLEDPLEEIQHIDALHQHSRLFPEGGLGFSSPLKLTMPQPIPSHLRRHASFNYPNHFPQFRASLATERPASETAASGTQRALLQKTVGRSFSTTGNESKSALN